jgi:methyl-accepting chemotaxis protein
MHSEPQDPINWMDSIASKLTLAPLVSIVAVIATMHVAAASISLKSELVVVAVGLFGAAVCGFVANQTRRRLERASTSLFQIAAGQPDVSVADDGATDEIGRIERSSHQLTDVIADRQAMAASSAEAESRAQRAEQERDSQRRDASRDYDSKLREVADGFQASVGTVIATLSKSVRDIGHSVESVSESMTQTSSRARAVEASSGDASDRVHAVASATEQLSASIREIDRQLSESARITREASEQARASEEVIRELSGASDKIGQVVGLISDIADQTSLLALNATIEAASAGDAGRGFAVVASEVKNLSGQTAKATQEIQSQIDAIQSATVRTAETLRSLGTTVNDIDGIANTLSVSVQEQSAATSEIAEHIEQAARQTQAAQQQVREVTGSTERGGTIAEGLSQTATGLVSATDELESEVGRFLRSMRAA